MSKGKTFRSARAASPGSGPLAGVSFALDGEVFHCEGNPSSFRTGDLARRARQADPADLLALTAESFLMVLGPAEYERFTRHVIEHGTPEEVIGEIAGYLNEHAGWRARLAGQVAR